ncbi:MAG: ABC transporter permease, partial [Betaproteobacteria bacterium]|nr:ABC transporter permease [Betaproteobacteria bacterium]
MIAASRAWRAGFTAAVAAPLKHQPGRLLLAVLGIALGVALGVAVHLINASALNEFSLAVHSLAGEADIVIRGPREGFAEDVYARVARLPEVRSASPAVEIDARVAGRGDTLKIVGLDPFRAAQVQPALLGDISDKVLELFDPRAILLSPAAAEALGLATGDTLAIQVGTSTVELLIIGLLPPESYRQRLSVMDIASAQWTLARLGKLNRIDLRLRPGTDVARFRADLLGALPAAAQAVTPDLEAERGASLTRAYRINLDMLALVALLTGGFLVFATQYLALLRRRGQL